MECGDLSPLWAERTCPPRGGASREQRCGSQNANIEHSTSNVELRTEEEDEKINMNIEHSTSNVERRTEEAKDQLHGVFFREPHRMTEVLRSSFFVLRSSFFVLRSSFFVIRSSFLVLRSKFDVRRSKFDVRSSTFHRFAQLRIRNERDRLAYPRVSASSGVAPAFPSKSLCP